jgi:hypothetical protein
MVETQFVTTLSGQLRTTTRTNGMRLSSSERSLARAQVTSFHLPLTIMFVVVHPFSGISRSCPRTSNCKKTVLRARLASLDDLSFICSSSCGKACDEIDNKGRSACTIGKPVKLNNDGDRETTDLIGVW